MRPRLERGKRKTQTERRNRYCEARRRETRGNGGKRPETRLAVIVGFPPTKVITQPSARRITCQFAVSSRPGDYYHAGPPITLRTKRGSRGNNDLLAKRSSTFAKLICTALRIAALPARLESPSTRGTRSREGCGEGARIHTGNAYNCMPQ